MDTTRNAPPARSLEVRVAEELRAELARQGRSRRWLAAQVELPQTTVARWLRGDTSPTLGELDAMCRALDLTVGRVLITVQRTGGYAMRPVAAVAG